MIVIPDYDTVTCNFLSLVGSPLLASLCRRNKVHQFHCRSSVIGQVLEHLGLWLQKPSKDPPSQEASHGNGDIVYEPFDDGWPGYEEPSHPILPYLLPLHLPAAGTVGFQNYSLYRKRSISEQKQKRRLTFS